MHPRNIQAKAVHPGHYNSTIGHTINIFPEYKPQGYGLLAKNDFNDRQRWNKYFEDAKGGKHFKYTCFPRRVINTDRQVYEVPSKLLNTSSTANSTGIRAKSAAEEERKPFKPSNPMKAGENGYIGQFMRLQPKNAPVYPTRKRKDPTKEERPNFKPSRGFKSRPTPSITLHMSNIRSSLVR